MKENFKKFYKTYIRSFIISLVVGAIIFVICCFPAGLGSINSSSIAALILLALGGFMFIADEGFFDFLTYGFKQVGSSIFGRKANENNDFAGYKEQNRAKRESRAKIYLSILASGLVFLIIFIILRIVYIP